MKVTVTGGRNLSQKFKDFIGRFGKNKQESVTVGFTQRYALYVHEINMYHRVGQWKYLETPARRLRPVINDLILRALQRGATFQQALMIGGLRIQRDAQQLTPVDTSALKASAFTCPTRDVEAISQQAYEKSENIRLAELASRAKGK